MLHLLMSEAPTGVGTSIGSMVTTTEGLTRHSAWGDDTWHEATGNRHRVVVIVVVICSESWHEATGVWW
jgi:hypothetical protein